MPARYRLQLFDFLVDVELAYVPSWLEAMYSPVMVEAPDRACDALLRLDFPASYANPVVRSSPRHTCEVRNRREELVFEQEEFYGSVYPGDDPLSMRAVMSDDHTQLIGCFRILFALLLARRRAFLLHGSCVDIEGSAVVLCGRSGIGKTTASRDLLREARERGLQATLVSTDAVAVEVEGGEARVRNFPFVPGRTDENADRVHRLDATFFLERADATSVRPMGPAVAYASLVHNILFPMISHPVYEAMLDAARRVRPLVGSWTLERSLEDGILEPVLGAVSGTRGRRGCG